VKIVFLGLSLTSSWGNGHATTYRGLVRELVACGHDVLFLERDKPWHAAHRDLPLPPYGRAALYGSLGELRDRWERELRSSDLAVVGSYVPEGREVCDWVCRVAGGARAFYDLDTPVTLASVAAGSCEYLSAGQIPAFDLYLSFTGGPTLRRLEREFGARRARALFCSFDPRSYFPDPAELRWDLGYLGTYSPDRQPGLERLMLEPARQRPEMRMVVAGAQYPRSLRWPENVVRIDHAPPAEHRAFYAGQRFTLNVTRQRMAEAGWSPSVRLFEAAACGVPIISDPWPGMEEFFRLEEEILISRSSQDTLRYLFELPEERRREIGQRARARVLAEHTARHRALQLEGYLAECGGR
jgi:spore maturation protein CgeB